MLVLAGRHTTPAQNAFCIVAVSYTHLGWSGDRKYHVTEADGTEHLLRLSPPALFERRKEEFARMQKAAALNLPMCMPEEFGVCSACELTDGSQMGYSLQRWIHGKDLEGLLHLLPETQQYVLGLRAGSILQKLHSIPAPESLEPWEERDVYKRQFLSLP